MNPFVNKVQFHPDRIAEWAMTGDTMPVTVELDMTNRCTNRCRCCAGGRTKRLAELDYDRVPALLGELDEAGVKAVIFTGGGDPLCHAKTPDAIACAADNNMDVALITNGVLLDVARQWDALRRCVWIRVSLDAANASMYRKNQGVDYWSAVTEHIRDVARKRGDEKSPTLGVGYLVDSETVDAIPEAAEVVQTLGVDYFQLRPYHHAYGEPGLAQKALRAYRRAQASTKNGYSVVWSEHKFRAMLEHSGIPSRSYKTCYGHAFATTIGAEGNVYLCCHMRGKGKYVLGNIYEQSFGDIWRGEQRQRVIESIDFADCVPLCRCDAFNVALWDFKHQRPEHVNFL